MESIENIRGNENINESMNLSSSVNGSVEDLINHLFSIDKETFWDILKQVRETNILSSEGIDDDWAIEDLIIVLNEGSFISIAKLAKWNDCDNLWNNAFKAYTEIMNLFWLNISEEYLRNLV